MNFKIGDNVRVVEGATYLNGKQIPNEVLKLTLIVRAINQDSCTIARSKTGPILGDVLKDNLINTTINSIKIEPYVVYLPETNFPLFHSPSKNSGVIRRTKRGLYTIIDEKNGFGKIKIGSGWVDLAKTMRM